MPEAINSPGEQVLYMRYMYNEIINKKDIPPLHFVIYSKIQNVS